MKTYRNVTERRELYFASAPDAKAEETSAVIKKAQQSIQKDEKESRWLNPFQTKVIPLSDPLSAEALSNELKLDENSHERLLETAAPYGSGFAVEVDDELIPLNPSAMGTFIAKHKEASAATTRYLKMGEFDLIADRFNVNHKKGILSPMLLFVGPDKKVNAFHSALQGDYVILPMDQVFDQTLSHIKKENGIKSFTCETSVDGISATFVLTTKIDYKAAFPTLKELFEDADPAIILETSNTGISSAMVNTVLYKKDGTQLPMTSAIATRHSGESTMEKFINSLDLLEASFTDGFNNLKELKGIDAKYAHNMMTRLLKKADLSKKYSSQILTDFDLQYDDGKATALDIFSCFSAVASYAKADEAAPLEMSRINDAVRRVAVYSLDDWKALDKPTPVQI